MFMVGYNLIMQTILAPSEPVINSSCYSSWSRSWGQVGATRPMHRFDSYSPVSSKRNKWSVAARRPDRTFLTSMNNDRNMDKTVGRKRASAVLQGAPEANSSG